MAGMDSYDLCLASNWEYDADFIRLLDSACAARGLSLLTVTPSNLTESLSLLARPEAAFSVLLDRASESDPAFLPLVEIAKTCGARRLNRRELADRAYDKALMNHAFHEAGIQTPFTIILPTYEEQPEIPALDLSAFNDCFTAKPALGGGGEGVVMEISTLQQALTARQEFPEQQYLLQAHITPAVIDGLPAWFRVIHCLGEIFPSFWNTTTHVYTRLTPEQENRLGPAGPREVTRRIAEVCGLDLFSTEIALTEEGQFLVVDHVNDPIDLRIKSKAVDGVPDSIILKIVEQIADFVQGKR